MRVTRESSWGKLINKQITRWAGSRQTDMRAHGTQKTRTEATCSQKTKTQAHDQQTNHQPCAKQDMNTQLMRKLISSRMHAHSHKETERGAWVSETLSRNRNSRHECWDPNTTLQHETKHADERAHWKPCAHMKPRHDGSIRALSQNYE